MKIGYTIEGKETANIEDNSCLAYSLIDENGEVYFIRRGTFGTTIGQFLNPWGIYYNSGDEKKFNSAVGKRLYEYNKVSKYVYELYVKFLQTKNDVYLNHAQRNI